MRDVVEEAIEAGVLKGDPDIVAHLYWSGIHGLVALHLSGMLAFGHSLEELVEAYSEREFGPEPGADSPANTSSPRSALKQIK